MRWLRCVPFLLMVVFFAHTVEAASTESRKRARVTINPATGKMQYHGATRIGSRSVTVAKTTARKSSSRATLKTVAKRGGRTYRVALSRSVKGVPRTHRVAYFRGEDPSVLSVRSAAALVIDLDQGQPLFEKNPVSVMPIASITKLMTAMVVLDAQLPLDERIAITDEDVDLTMRNHSRLPVGAELPRSELLRVALMASDNRAAVALGRTYPGGLPAFVQAMNEKARSLGMNNSRFVEPSGLNSSNVSTARDLAQIVRGSYEYPLIREYSTTESFEVEVADGRERVFNNTNGLVRSSEWEIGLQKTGYISEAGRCLVMHATIAARPYIIVLLDAVGRATRIADANRIKRWIEVRYNAKPGLI